VKNSTKPLTDKEISEQVKRFEWLQGFLVCRYHFVHRVLGYMTKTKTEKVPTMGVTVSEGGRLNLYWNALFFYGLSDAEATFVLRHEVMHIVLHHCTGRKFSDHEIGNIAQDLAINELIDVVQGICERPESPNGGEVGCFVSEFKKNPIYADMKEKESAEYYYDYLQAKMPKVTLQIMGGGGPGQEKGKGRQSNSGQGQDGKGNQKTLGSGKDVIKVRVIDDHGGHQEHEVAEERIRAIVRDIDRNNLWGNTPGDIKERILAAQVKKINWRNLIRTWFGYFAYRDKEATRKRPNRRMGYLYPGTKKLYVDKWLLAVDTSGSQWQEDILSEMVGVMNQLVEEIPIDVVQFDTAIQEAPKPYDRRQSSFNFKGCGGTSFDPVIKLVDKRRYKGVMILTDGQAEAPPKPKMARVLWVLRKGNNPPVDWGTKVYAERRA